MQKHLSVIMKIVLTIMESLKGSQDTQGFPDHTLPIADISSEVQEMANGDGF